MAVDTIHVMDAEETASEAIKNYAGAAFLVGLAVVAIGMGAGMISQAIVNLRKKPSSTFSDDLMDAIRKNVAKPSAAASEVKDRVTTSAQDILRKTAEDLLHGRVIDQSTSEEPVLYYVKKSFKEPVVVGGMIPLNALVVKSDTQDLNEFLALDNLKFKSKLTSTLPGGVVLVTVQEILNSEPAKQV